MPDDAAQALMISGRQIREARTMLGWSGETLCERANIQGGILVRAESVDGTPMATAQAPADRAVDGFPLTFSDIVAH